MKVHALGVKRMKGVSAKSGQEYDFAAVAVLTPVEVVSNSKVQITGYGFEQADIPLAVDAVSKFSQVRFPCELELELEQEFRGGQFRTVCRGFKPVGARPAAVAGGGNG